MKAKIFEEKVLENFSTRWHSLTILKTWQRLEGTSKRKWFKKTVANLIFELKL